MHPLLQRPDIYVLDDDASVLRALSRLLRSAGLECTTYSSGAEFLAAISPTSRGCLVMDIRMSGLVGHDVQRELIARNSQIAVIAVSAQDDDETRHRARELGAVAFFRKPVDDQALLDAIKWTTEEIGPLPGSAHSKPAPMKDAGSSAP